MLGVLGAEVVVEERDQRRTEVMELMEILVVMVGMVEISAVEVVVRGSFLGLLKMA